MHQVLYFTCNSIDNQIYIDFENYFSATTILSAVFQPIK